jgi:epoxyqueuosine reductase
MEIVPWLSEQIRDFVRTSPDNALGNGSGEPAWQDPLVGFAGGADPLFAWLKQDIGEFLWAPGEILALTFPDRPAAPEAVTVVSWILPQTEATKEDNRRQMERPAERWARSRKYGEEFNVLLARHVVEILRGRGINAVAPSLGSPLWGWRESARYGFASTWSERHAAHVAGLGTFGLCDGLITPAGKAMRCGSVVAAFPSSPPPRPYSDPRAYCLFFSNGTCGKCIPRCPVGAITERGHDKARCRAFLFETLAADTKERFGFESYGCGLCQTGVPCTSGIPVNA